MGYQTGSVTANVLNTSATQKTMISLSNSVTSGTDTVIGTVGAGKTWTIIRVDCGASISTAATGSMIIKANAVIVCTASALGTTSGVSQTAMVAGDYTTPIAKITAGQTITYTCSNNTVGDYSIQYVEESV